MLALGENGVALPYASTVRSAVKVTYLRVKATVTFVRILATGTFSWACSRTVRVGA
jgi:hypothetical protein